MTYEEEAEVAQRVLDKLAGMPQGTTTRAAQVNLNEGVGYSVHRHGNDLRFNQYTNLRSGEVGRYAIVAIGQHRGGWMVARSVRPPGEFYDERVAETARRRVEVALSELGYEVGGTGMEGKAKTAGEMEMEARELRRAIQPIPQPIRRAHLRTKRSKSGSR